MLLTEICKVVGAAAGRFPLALCRHARHRAEDIYIQKAATLSALDDSEREKKRNKQQQQKRMKSKAGGAAILFKVPRRGEVEGTGGNTSQKEPPPASNWPPAPLKRLHLFNSLLFKSYSVFLAFYPLPPPLKGELAFDKTAKNNSDQPQRKHFLF